MASKDLFPEQSRAAYSRPRGHAMPRSLRRIAPAPAPVGPRARAGRPTPRLFDSWEAAIRTSFGPPTTTWLYHDATGQVVGVVARFRAGAAGKTFRQASLRHGSTWAATGMPKPRPLYRLPDLLASHGTVYVAEGEKCADALAAIGLVATTSIGGASSPHHSDWTPLANRDVVVVPDADEQGDQYASAVAALARGAGATQVFILGIAGIWPDVPPKGDIADWIATQPKAPSEKLRDVVEHRVADAIPTQLPSLQSIIISRRMAGPASEVTDEG